MTGEVAAVVIPGGTSPDVNHGPTTFDSVASFGVSTAAKRSNRRTMVQPSVPKIFTPSLDDARRLISDYPFAQVISSGEDGLRATPLPLMLTQGDDGREQLIGHFARSNPHVADLRREPDALVLFSGPHGYISPSWMADRTQAPTWNFTSVQLRVRIEFDDQETEARDAVDILTQKMEKSKRNGWAPIEMGERYSKLIRGVVAFKAPILSMTAKFKLGQNERKDVLIDILTGLGKEGQAKLEGMMLEANEDRLTVTDLRCIPEKPARIKPTTVNY